MQVQVQVQVQVRGYFLTYNSINKANEREIW